MFPRGWEEGISIGDLPFPIKSKLIRDAQGFYLVTALATIDE
jgi:hypothetical protein